MDPDVNRMHPAGCLCLRRTHIPALKSSRKDCRSRVHMREDRKGEQKGDSRGQKKVDSDRRVVIDKFLCL